MLDVCTSGMDQTRPRLWPKEKCRQKEQTHMKFCHSCGKASAGDPLFCTKCGRTYDVRLCPRLHQNSRWAKACSQCGSRELSEPQPRVSFWWKVLGFLARVFLGLFLLYLSLYVLLALLRRPEVQGGVVIVGILLGFLWWLWSALPEWFQKLVRRSLKRKERERE
jgi:hypothetical protein